MVLNKGQSISSDHLRIKYAYNRHRAKCRWAIVVSRKVNKKAVVRNRVRRRLYAIIGNYWSHFDKNLDLVIIVTSDRTAEIPARDLKQEVLALWSQMEVD